MGDEADHLGELGDLDEEQQPTIGDSLRALPRQPRSRIHHTIGVYPNGSMKHNGVPTENLADHVEYNKKWRPGRALFVDGVCVYEGLMSTEALAKAKTAVALMMTDVRVQKPTKDTQPYQ